MAACFIRFLNDESGMVITAELVMIITIAVISISAGWGAASSMLVEELEDVANSVGSLDQSFNYRGISAPGHATSSGGGFNDSSNLVNVSTSTNFNASVAGLDFTPLIPDMPQAAAALAGEPFVLIEEELGVNAQIDAAQLDMLESLSIVEVREDGAVLLLREDLVEIQDDGSIQILDEQVRREGELLQQSQENGRIRAQSSPGTVDSARKEIDATRAEINKMKEELKAQSNGSLDELQQENARLKELIERLCRETQSR